VTDKLEDVFVEKYGKYFGLQPGQVETLGSKLGRGWVDYVALITLRATPLISSTLISVGCGLLKIPLRLFIISTYLGSVIRDIIYLYIGYTGISTFKKFLREANEISENIIIAVIVCTILYLGYRYYIYRFKNSK